MMKDHNTERNWLFIVSFLDDALPFFIFREGTVNAVSFTDNFHRENDFLKFINRDVPHPN